MNMYIPYYSALFKISYLIFIVPTILVIVSAILSARSMGGSLGQGLKKVATGTIVDTILIATYIFLERGYQGILSSLEIRLFFLGSGLFASILLISGYIQLYRIAKKFRLFTP